MNVVYLPKESLQLSLNHNSLVIVFDKEFKPKGEGSVLTEISMTAFSSTAYSFRDYDEEKMISCFYSQIEEVVELLRKKEEEAGLIGLVRRGLSLQLNATEHGDYKTVVRVFAFVFPVQVGPLFEDYEKANLADIAGEAEKRAKKLVETFDDKFIGD